MNKAVFLDRDGTINVDKDYLYKVEDFEFLPGVLDGLRKFQDAGYLLIIITNQSGIARGYYSEVEFEKLNSWMIGKLQSEGINIEKTYYCPHHPNALIPEYRKKCECRKPGIKLFQDAVHDFDIDLNSSIAIGDKERDLDICKCAGTKGFLIYSNEETIGKISHIKGGILDAANISLEINEE